MKILSFFGLFLLYFKTVICYLSEQNYRSFNYSTIDTSSLDFYSKWILNLMYVSNYTPIYLKDCEDGFVFGYFRFGNISMFYSDKQYGSLGFNFNIVLIKSTLNLAKPDDSIWVIFNHDQVTTKINLHEVVRNSTLQVICGQEVYVTPVSAIFINHNALIYSDVLMTISSNVHGTSTVDWGVNGIKVNKVSCAPKCLICDFENCLGCDSDTIYQSNLCVCNNTLGYYDLGGINETISCECNF